jgi:hypothetical protein
MSFRSFLGMSIVADFGARHLLGDSIPGRFFKPAWYTHLSCTGSALKLRARVAGGYADSGFSWTEY